MAKAAYIGVDGVSQKVKQPYIGIDGVARKVTKCYVGVDNVARLCYMAGTQWEKWNCTRTLVDDYWKENPTSGLIGRTDYYDYAAGLASYDYHASYGFSRSSGFYASDPAGFDTSDPLSNANWCYEVSNATVRVINIVEPVYGSDSTTITAYRFHREIVAVCERVREYSYSKGTTSYGAVTVPGEGMPSEGTYVEGSIAQGYCVRYVNGTYYYYTLIT